jgi:WS/DGAT/MGAT family acyltransferase
VGSSASRLIDRARPDDVLHLAVDRGRVPMAIGALLVLEPGRRPRADKVRATLLHRAAGVPRLAQRLATTPPGAGRPVWLDAGSDVLAELVDGLVVPTSGTAEPGAVSRELLDATADLVMHRLTPERPLWRARLLLDSGGGVLGIAIVAHHVLADGMGGLAVLGALADGGPAGPVRPAERLPEARPPWRDLARDAWTGRLPGLRTPGTAVRRVGGGLDELGLRRPHGAERCSLLAPSSGRRRLAVCHVELAGTLASARTRNATVNDLVVTAVTGALVRLLERRGERIGELVVSVPVSRRRQGDAASLGNATGVVPVRVPAVVDAQERLTSLLQQEARVRSTGRGGSAAVLTPLFRTLAAVGAFQAFVDHQHLVHTFVTNLRGPAERLSFAGSPVAAVVPVAVNPGNVTLSFDVLSYAGTLGITVVADPVRVPENDWFRDVLEEELRAVVGAGG